MKIKSFLFLLVVFCFFQKAKAQFIKVDDTFNTQHLVEKVLVNSSCAQVSNFSESGDTFTPSRKSLGFFDFKPSYDCDENDAACNTRLTTNPVALPLQITVTIGERKSKVYVAVDSLK